MTINQQQHLFASDLAKLVVFAIEYANTNGYSVQIGEVKRTEEQQDIYLKQGLSKRKDGLHLYSLAVDINLIGNGRFLTDTIFYKPLGDFWKSLHVKNNWGGDWVAPHDPFHFERERV